MVVAPIQQNLRRKKPIFDPTSRQNRLFLPQLWAWCDWFFSAYLEEQEDSDSDASPGFQAPRPKRGKRQKPPAVSDDSSGPRLQSRPAIRRAAAIARSRIVENETWVSLFTFNCTENVE